MKKLNKWQNATFIIGAVLMVAGAVASILKWPYSAWIFSIGAVAYVVIQLMQSYEGDNFVIRRLRRIQMFSGLLLLATGVLMFAGTYNFLTIDWLSYLHYVRNNWVVTLLLAAVLQLYTVQRIGTELEKETKKM